MEFTSMGPINWYILGTLLALNIPVYLFLGKIVFRDLDSFSDAIVFWITPDLWSLFSGQFLDDFLAELRLGFWFALCAGAVLGEYYGVVYLARELSFL